MILAVPDVVERPEECSTCKAQTPPKAGYCAPARCYCLHPTCPAYARTVAVIGERVEAVEPVPLEHAAGRSQARREESRQIREQLHADLRARRAAGRS